eukprot:CAMPEP_0201579116 /NCGR_PEP_ID=MMETSP0190_2-20130828/26429_1 /ASSEMBLY_ACC=CAM_ASM_000263 /TAXON_ID=37353 /ORGANISM="Rosalina sp." /LENGTH=50 /DNA_ID=CAMNT_0048013113 /DNA_START=375 /DNA_END=527 /DNA_ORIENTATION=+
MPMVWGNGGNHNVAGNGIVVHEKIKDTQTQSPTYDDKEQQQEEEQSLEKA